MLAEVHQVHATDYVRVVMLDGGSKPGLWANTWTFETHWFIRGELKGETVSVMSPETRSPIDTKVIFFFFSSYIETPVEILYET